MHRLEPTRGRCCRLLRGIVWVAVWWVTIATADAGGTYRIEASVDPTDHALKGSAHVRFENVSEHPLDRLIVEYFAEGLAGSDRLLAQTEDGASLGLIPADRPDTNGATRFLLRLPSRLEAGDSIDLVFSFSQVWPHRAGLPWETGERWYPRIDPGYPVAYAFEVALTAPDGMRYASSGAITGREEVRGSQGLERFETIHFESKPALTFQLAALPSESWQETSREVAGVQVRAFWEDEHWAKWLPRFADFAGEIIEYYIGEFGFYPAKSLCIVPGSMGSTGGGPVAPGIIAIHDVEKLGEDAIPFAKWIISHEIGHQYWGEYVLSSEGSSYTHDWLSIGLGLYTDRHWTETFGLLSVSHHHGFDYYLRATRAGKNTTIRLGGASVPDPTLDRNNAVVHSKGYAVIRALEMTLGKEVFRRAIDECLVAFANREMSIEAFRQVCEKHTGRDLRWFFRNWLETTRTLAYTVIDTEGVERDGAHLTTVTLAKTGEIAMSVPVVARFHDGSEQSKWTDRELDYPVLVFESDSAVEQVLIDPEKTLPMIEKPASALPEPVVLRDRREIEAGLGERELIRQIQTAMGDYGPDACKRAANHLDQAIEESLQDQHAWMLLGMALYDGERYADALTAFKRMEKARGKLRGNALVWQGHLNDLLGNRADAIACYESALRAGVPPLQHGQYNINMDRHYVEQFLTRPYVRQGH